MNTPRWIFCGRKHWARGMLLALLATAPMTWAEEPAPRQQVMHNISPMDHALKSSGERRLSNWQDVDWQVLMDKVVLHEQALPQGSMRYLLNQIRFNSNQGTELTLKVVPSGSDKRIALELKQAF